MDVSGTSSVSAATSINTSVAIEVQKKTQEIQKETVASLIEALPDPMSSLGQNIDTKA